MNSRHDAGAEDVKTEGDMMEIYTKPDALEKCGKFRSAKIKVESSEIQMVPETMVTVDEKPTQALNCSNRLEELDDVQNVYSNVDIPESVMAAIQSAA